MAEVVVQHVGKLYSDRTRAVEDLTLEVRDREFVVIVGPSGSGKTTALRMIAGLEEISEGTIAIGGRVVNHVPTRDRNIAMVFQSYALYPHLTVHDNLAFGLQHSHVPRREIERRVNDAVATLDLDDYLRRKPRQLSGGQRQRVALGRAIVRHGRLQQFAPPKEIYARPANAFVGGFMGSPAMNFLAGTIQRASGEVSVLLGQESLALASSVLRRRPLLARYEGKAVIVGIRPETLQDAALVPDAPPEGRLHGTVEVREALGPELFVHFTAPQLRLATLR
jgi:multiple sugar transport system ATP-binding protein